VRRVVEITLVVAVLVAMPIGVAVYAGSQGTANEASSALAAARRILGTTSVGGARIALSGCQWTSDRSRILCRATGPGDGTCAFTASGGGGCEGSSGDSFWTLRIGGDRR
jgi:hypothetical protein